MRFAIPVKTPVRTGVYNVPKSQRSSAPTQIMNYALEIARDRLFAELAKSLDDGPTLDAMRRVPRERFVAPEFRSLAYYNIPLSIGHGQTISQPLIVAKATAALGLRGDEDVLEVGAGSGYQAAVLAELLPFGRVVAVERIPELAAMARRNLANRGIANAKVLPSAGDTLGAPDDGPFDAIMVSAGAPGVPHALIAQLKSGGRMVLPVGDRESQTLTLVRLTPRGLVTENLGGCRFVPLLGDGGWPNHPA